MYDAYTRVTEYLNKTVVETLGEAGGRGIKLRKIPIMEKFSSND